MTEPMPGASQAAPPVCPRHPDRVAYVRCQRCERPACPDCQVPAPVGVLCVDCSRAADKTARNSTNALGLRRAKTVPVLTYALIAANVLFFVYGRVTDLYQWQFRFGLIPLLADSEPWRFVTSAFVHAGELHLGLNMLMLYQFGTQLESLLGRVRFAALYGVSLLGGSASIYLLAPSNQIHIGASGAIFGLFAAYGVLLYKVKLGWQSLAAQAGIWFVAGFLIPGISWQGHLGGAVGGFVTMLALMGYAQWRNRRPAPPQG